MSEKELRNGLKVLEHTPAALIFIGKYHLYFQFAGNKLQILLLLLKAGHNFPTVMKRT